MYDIGYPFVVQYGLVSLAKLWLLNIVLYCPVIRWRFSLRPSWPTMVGTKLQPKHLPRLVQYSLESLAETLV